MSLPALRLLGESDLDRGCGSWAVAPAMEYLDALLADGASFAAVADRLAGALGDAAGYPATRPRPVAPTELPLPAAEAAALTAAGVLLGELSQAQRRGAGAADPCVGAPVAHRPRRAAVPGRPVQPGRARRAGGRVPGGRAAGRRSRRGSAFDVRAPVDRFRSCTAC